MAKQIGIAKPTAIRDANEESKDGDVSSNSLMVYACGIDEVERRDLAFDLP